jgi:hypothetical protein
METSVHLTAVLRSFGAALFALSLLFFVDAKTVLAQTVEVPLTPDIVEGFIASYPDVRAKGEELKAQHDVPGGNDVTAWQAWIAVGAAKSQLDAAVQAYGFSDFNTWLQTFSTIARAYAFVREGSALDTKLTEAIEKVRNDPNIPDGQKEMILQQLQHSGAAIASMRPSEESLKAVEPYSEQLKNTLDNN